LKSGEEIKWDKLVLATGSLPVIPKWLPGHDLENVFPIIKDEEYLSNMLSKLKEINEVVIIGGGFIGVEFAEQLALAGKHVTLVEIAHKILWQAFDDEFASIAEEDLESHGVTLKLGTLQGRSPWVRAVLPRNCDLAASKGAPDDELLVRQDPK